MRGEDDKKGGAYFYKKCPSCGAKLHICGLVCQNCMTDYWKKCMTGEWKDRCFVSTSPEDAIYSRPMNNVEKCMKCRNVKERGVICKQKYCFATGRGNCESCSTFDPTIFDCCQEEQKEKGVPDINKKALTGMCKEVARQYTDVVPF